MVDKFTLIKIQLDIIQFSLLREAVSYCEMSSLNPWPFFLNNIKEKKEKKITL